DYLIVESTYGNRKHPQTDGLNRLKESVLEIVQSGGTLLIPAFTVGRAQQIMYAISQLKSGNLIPDIPIFLNSPMAINVCDLYSHYANEHKIGKEALRKMFDGVNYISSAEDSKALNKERGVRVIISASGMATGGRVLFHLEELAPDPRNQILFAGYQAAGTRGSTLVSGCDEIKIHGQYVPVRAKVKNLDSFSAHADYQEILDWLGRSRLNPKRVFICHGEPEASDAMRRRIEERFHWPCTIPQVQDSWELT
ncbi:MAG: MBL fold metallo-hydrolase RNA specificity domain-containing protein, partial [Bdellovibrionales bacterium]